MVSIQYNYTKECKHQGNLTPNFFLHWDNSPEKVISTTYFWVEWRQSHVVYCGKDLFL